MKSLQNEEKEKKGDGPTANKGPCKYFLTESGSRRGQACKWAHQLDKSDKSGGERRCFTCGATQHMAKDCPRKETPPNELGIVFLSPKMPMANLTLKDISRKSFADVEGEGPERQPPRSCACKETAWP